MITAIISISVILVFTIYFFLKNIQWYKSKINHVSNKIEKKPIRENPYCVEVENKTDEVLNAVVFGYNDFSSCPNYGSDIGVTVSVPFTNVSYFKLLSQSVYKPFDLGYIRITSTKSEHVTPILEITSSDANGCSCFIPIKTMDYFSPSQFQSVIIDVFRDDYPIKIDGGTCISFKSPANSKICFSFFPKRKEELKPFELSISGLIKSDLNKIKESFKLRINKIKSFFKKK